MDAGQVKRESQACDKLSIHASESWFALDWLKLNEQAVTNDSQMQELAAQLQDEWPRGENSLDNMLQSTLDGQSSTKWC
jgi:hypothetical protein